MMQDRYDVVQVVNRKWYMATSDDLEWRWTFSPVANLL